MGFVALFCSEMDSDLIKLEEDGVSRDHDLGDIDYAAVNADEDESVLLGKMVARAHRELKRDGLGRQAVDMEWQICGFWLIRSLKMIFGNFLNFFFNFCHSWDFCVV